ncbi:hypothetical protein BH11PSE11_BH11PSE11_19620 [soil metagenome]
MRSRYTAYVQGNESWLQASWHHSTRPSEALVNESADQTKWLGLDIRRHEQNGDQAVVEFVARFKIGGRASRLHEVSRFVREAGHWFYVDGSFPGEKGGK